MEQTNSNMNTEKVQQKKWPYVISIIIGILLVSIPQFASLVSLAIEVILGWFLTIAAFVQISFLIFSKEKDITMWFLPLALLVIGFYFLLNPASALALMSLLFSGIAFLSGITSLIQSFSVKGNIKTFLIINAIIGFIFAFMIWSNWPSSGISFIGTLLGIQLVISGITRMVYMK